MEIIAITISVNYSDILKHILPNSKFFKEWIIVTTHEDDTNELIKNSGIENIKIIHFDGFYKDSVFNFGGSRRFAQEYINDNYTDQNILFLDGDILLPDTFTLPEKIENDTLYGVNSRYDYHTLDDFLNNTNGRLYAHSRSIVGFFQLFKQCDKFYKESKNCSQCDLNFKHLFKHFVNLNISVKHLGEQGVNWNGRKNAQF